MRSCGARSVKRNSIIPMKSVDWMIEKDKASNRESEGADSSTLSSLYDGSNGGKCSQSNNRQFRKDDSRRVVSYLCASPDRSNSSPTLTSI